MNWQDILYKFYRQIDDSSELSDDEGLDLLNDVYGDICDDRDWEWLKATATGTTSTTVPYIALPADFKKMTISYNGERWLLWGNVWVPAWFNQPLYPNYLANYSVVFVGTNRTPYQVIPYSDKDNYYNQSGFCYIDIPNSRLVFTRQPTSAETVTYTYIKIPSDITLATSPIFRSGFHNIFAYGMGATYNVLVQTDKNMSYRRENLEMYNQTLEKMRLEDSNLKLAL